MTARVEHLSSTVLRWFMAPAALGALLAGFVAVLRHRARQPSLPRMSDDWLKSHDIDSGRGYPW
jgi:hypothetical protein